MSYPLIISIDGNIGSGKSRLLSNLKKYYKNNLRVHFLPEPIDIWNTITDESGNTILSRYYSNQKQWAFHFQMMTYISRLSLLKKALKNDYDVIITERSVHTDKYVFAKMLYDEQKMDKIEHTIYEKWFDEFIEDIPQILMIYVQTNPYVANERVLKRKREGEQIPIEYLENCNNYHNTWFDSKPIDEKMLINGDIDIDEHPKVINVWVDSINKFIQSKFL